MDSAYVYHEYFDDDAYGEQITKLFHDFGQASAHLESRIKQMYAPVYGNTLDEIWDNLKETGAVDDEDIKNVTEDSIWISISNGDGAACFYTVEKHPIE